MDPTSSPFPILASSRRSAGWSRPSADPERSECESTGVKADKIYLVGFMAAGKTTLARALARRLDWAAVDIDELIEKREHMTVADIFSRHGEPHFRALERAVLADQLQ